MCVTQRDYLWLAGAAGALVIEYAIIAFGYPARTGAIWALLVAPGLLSTALGVLAPAGRRFGVTMIFLVCVVALREPLTTRLDFADPSGAGAWLAAVALYGAPVAALYVAERRTDPELVPARLASFVRAAAVYFATQAAACLVLLILVAIFGPRIG